MSSITLALCLLCFVFQTSHADQDGFDCKMRQLAIEFAHKIQPFRTKDHFQQIVDALNGSPEAANCSLALPLHLDETKSRFALFDSPAATAMYYVDATKGSDSNAGTMDKPFKSIAHAVQVSRSASSPTTILLRAGTFYLNKTIELGPEDSGLTLQNYNGEEVWISGAKPIAPQWKAFNVSKKNTTIEWIVEQNANDIRGAGSNTIINSTYKTWQECESMCKANGSCNVWTWHDQTTGNKWAYKCVFRNDGVWKPRVQEHHVSGYKKAFVPPNIYVADLASIAAVPGLRLNGHRAIRARYPNADPELGFGSEMKAAAWNAPVIPQKPDKDFQPEKPFRNTSNSFQYYTLGIGGPCKNFDPPAGYWCSSNVEGGGANTYTIPSGMVANLTNMPYKNATGAIIQAWRPGHWASWMFEVGDYDRETGNFTFSKGGFQGARGRAEGDEYYIENVFEELDYPGEYYYDEVNRKLYLFYNGTGMPPTDIQFAVTNVKTLVRIMGTQQKPVVDLTMRGIGFRDTAYTYMDPHGMPSGGDWALERMGAVFVEGTMNFTVDSCLFERLDGNAIMLSGYNRYATVQKSDFSWLGSTAIASWGYTNGSDIVGMGPDGTEGNQPRFNQILYNFVRELGIWEKQSSFYFQAKSCQNLLKGNIFFNGPRAGINFNDGFGGGSNVTENLLFNTCRESSDHGPFNSWDRQVYVTKVADGKTPSPIKQYDYINYNFVVANYGSLFGIDNDDGSAYYETHHNFISYGEREALKNDFGGHDNHHHHNIDAYLPLGFGICPQRAGHEDFFYNNSVILLKDGDYGRSGAMCGGPGTAGKPVLHDNRIYTPNGNVTECKMPLKKWQAQSKENDPGTTAAVWPNDDELIGWARQLLGTL